MAWDRHCIGQPLARMNVTAVLASLLANLSFRLAEPVRHAFFGFPLLIHIWHCLWRTSLCFSACTSKTAVLLSALL